MFGSSPAFAFVLTMGVVNLFGDMTYLATLGASAAAVPLFVAAYRQGHRRR